MNILALHVDLESVQAAVLDVATRQPVGPIASIPLTPNAPMPEASELTPESVWQAVAAAARTAVQQARVAGRPGQDIEAVGLATMMPALVMLDSADRPIGAIWTPADRRTRPVARQVEA